MVTEAKILRVQSPTQEQHPAQVRESKSLANGACDLFLFHNTTDGFWTTELAERLHGARFGNRNLRLSLTDWNSARGANTLVEIGEKV